MLIILTSKSQEANHLENNYIFQKEKKIQEMEIIILLYKGQATSDFLSSFQNFPLLRTQNL